MKRIYPPTQKDLAFGMGQSGKIHMGYKKRSRFAKLGGRVYLDYAATTPVDPWVLRAMQPYFSRTFGNPSSLHYFGQQAIAAVDDARETIAKTIGADFREIIFTGSATEANNLALRGVMRGISNFSRYAGSRVAGEIPISKQKPRIIISAVEHESVRETARELELEGVEVIEISVDRYGVVDLKKLEASLNERTALVSIIYANNEIGTVQPLFKIAQIISNFKKRITNYQFPISKRDAKKELEIYPLFHSDAAQAFQFLSCVPSDLSVDLMTFSAHKIYGPKGIGALYIGSRVWGLGSRKDKNILHPSGYTLTPFITGGGQEFGLRSGTENVPLIAGFAKAVEIANFLRGRERVRVKKLSDYFWAKLKRIAPRAELTVPCVEGVGTKSDAPEFLPNILNVHFPGVAAEYMITKLDLFGIAVSSGSACRSRAVQSSHVIGALGFSDERALETIRISLGRQTTTKGIDEALKKIK